MRFTCASTHSKRFSTNNLRRGSAHSSVPLESALQPGTPVALVDARPRLPQTAHCTSGGVERCSVSLLSHRQRDRIAAGLPFVESLARRVASSMPHSIELGDLVQDGMLGLIDAAFRFDEARGIKFETFAERRVRGAMIDALRRDAWPRGVRRQRRELEAAREELRRELGAEPSLADLAARVGSDEARLGRTIVRINTIESTSPLSAGDNVDGASLPAALVPSEPPAPDQAYEEREVRDRVRAAIASLPPRERKVIGLYYYAEATMKQIGAEIGVNESRVSQLHARAIQRLRKALGAECSAARSGRRAAAGDPVVPADDAPHEDGARPSCGTAAGVVLDLQGSGKAGKRACMTARSTQRRCRSARGSRRGASCQRYADHLAARPAGDPSAGTASRASGSRSPRGTAPPRCRRRRRSRTGCGAPSPGATPRARDRTASRRRAASSDRR